jgi:hypothetical protein
MKRLKMSSGSLDEDCEKIEKGPEFRKKSSALKLKRWSLSFDINYTDNYILNVEHAHGFPTNII